MNITIPNYPTETYELIDGEFVPAHEDAEIEPACCSGIDSDGNTSCGCHGSDSVHCPAIDCPGITDDQADMLFERLRPEPDYDTE